MASPPPSPFTLYRTLSALRHIHRFQGFQVVWPESVAEHSFYVAMLADLFATELRALGYEIEPQVTLYALWHDAAEALTGDLPHNIKRQLGDAFAGIEAEAEATLTRATGVYADFPAPPPDSLAALVVKLADWAELLLYVATEKRSGNYTIAIAERRIWALLRGEMAERMGRFGDEAASWYVVLLHGLDAATGGPGGGPPEREEPA